MRERLKQEADQPYLDFAFSGNRDELTIYAITQQ